MHVVSPATEYLEKPQNQTVCEGDYVSVPCIAGGVPYISFKVNDSTDLINTTVTTKGGENGTILGELSLIASAETKIQCCYQSPSSQSCANPPAYINIQGTSSPSMHNQGLNIIPQVVGGGEGSSTIVIM